VTIITTDNTNPPPLKPGRYWATPNLPPDTHIHPDTIDPATWKFPLNNAIDEALYKQLKALAREGESVEDVIHRLLSLAELITEELEGYRPGGMPL
jgi:hypothetical protein